MTPTPELDATTKKRGHHYYGDEFVSRVARMPYGAYGRYEQSFYDGHISWEDFNDLCCKYNYGDDLSVDDLKKMGMWR